MFIKQITIEGVDGDVEVIRSDDGALITAGNRVLCEVRRDESRETRFLKAYEVAKVVCGQSRRGGKLESNATNSLIHEVLIEIERVAGC